MQHTVLRACRIYGLVTPQSIRTVNSNCTTGWLFANRAPPSHVPGSQSSLVTDNRTWLGLAWPDLAACTLKYFQHHL